MGSARLAQSRAPSALVRWCSGRTISCVRRAQGSAGGRANYSWGGCSPQAFQLHGQFPPPGLNAHRGHKLVPLRSARFSNGRSRRLKSRRHQRTVYGKRAGAQSIALRVLDWTRRGAMLRAPRRPRGAYRKRAAGVPPPCPGLLPTGCRQHVPVHGVNKMCYRSTPSGVFQLLGRVCITSLKESRIVPRIVGDRR